MHAGQAVRPDIRLCGATVLLVVLENNGVSVFMRKETSRTIFFFVEKFPLLLSQYRTVLG